MEREPNLTAAAVVHHVVGDLLHQRKFEFAHFPELVDLTVIAVGLGILQSNFRFVKQSPMFWDSTNWAAVPRPFLDANGLAYANALAAWARGEKDPAWSSELSRDVKRPMQKSLKYLFSTRDSFFQMSAAGQDLLNQPQGNWMEMAASDSVSTQVVAIRNLAFEETLGDRQETLVLEKLQSTVQPIVLHSISAAAELGLNSESVAVELRLLASQRDDEIRAKAMLALAKLGLVDDATIDRAAGMIDDRVHYVVYAGLVALLSLETASEKVLRAADRGLVRALQTCNYEFVGLFVAAYDRWLDEPQAYIERLLEGDQPDYLEIAVEALKGIESR